MLSFPSSSHTFDGDPGVDPTLKLSDPRWDKLMIDNIDRGVSAITRDTLGVGCRQNPILARRAPLDGRPAIRQYEWQRYGQFTRSVSYLNGSISHHHHRYRHPRGRRGTA